MRFGLLSGSGLRAEGFTAALISRGHAAPVHLTYAQYIQNPDALRRLLTQLDVLRVDSPGGGFDIWQCFADLTGNPATGFQKRHGQIYPQAPFVEGTFSSVKSASDLANKQGVPCTADPNAVSLFMDKSRTHAFCQAHDFPVPQKLPGAKSCKELENQMSDLGFRRVFMKLRYGSAASGVLAIEKQGQRLRILTSTEMKKSGDEIILYNSLKIRKYLEQDARFLIDHMLANFEIHTEEWIPKLRLDDKPADIRLLVIDQKPAHLVLRSSSGPITNLHLGNQRHAADTLRNILPAAIWDGIHSLGEAIGQLFPDQFCFGLDIGIDRKMERIFIIEINAFGDHLHHVDFDGMDPYTYQLRALEQKYAGC